MTPLQPKKKRSAGRPKENKLLRELKVKTWFNAVAEASGKTAYELEKEFSPTYVDRDKFHKQRSRLWEKYRTGKVMPTMKETKGGRRPVALMVEERYPGTIKWLQSPIWELLDLEIEINMNNLRSIYEYLDPEITTLIIDDKNEQLFWRKHHHDPERLVAMLHQVMTMDTLIALVCLWRESIICQQPKLYNSVITFFRCSSGILVEAIGKVMLSYTK
jgi:hypothetical protein